MPSPIRGRFAGVPRGGKKARKGGKHRQRGLFDILTQSYSPRHHKASHKAPEPSSLLHGGRSFAREFRPWG